MSLIEEVKQALKAQEHVRKKADYAKFSSFYEKMSALGVIQKQQYVLPPLDTTGKRVREMMCQKTC